MLLLTSTADIVRLTTGTATTTIEVHTSYVDVSGSVITPGRTNTRITTAATTTIVASPAASTQRNVKAIYCTNNSTGTSCTVAVEHFDGTNSIELISFVLLPGENLGYREDGSWVHRDAQGAEYPPAGLGAYTGKSIPFMKTGTAPDATGYWYGTWKDGGFPGAWSPGAPGLNGRVTDGTVAADYGCIPISNPAVGANFLTSIDMAASVNHTHIFFDVLWVNSGLVVTTTTAQAITIPALPARDVNGTTAGEGTMIGIMCTSASGLAAIASNATMTYTNSKGVAGKVATLVAIVGSQAPATPVIGTIIWFNLAAGDTGVGAGAANVTLGTSWVSGTISLFIARDIATIGTVLPNVSATKPLVSPGVRLYNGSCILHAILSSAATATFFSGELTVTEK
jgi:hypothetical protein